MDFEFRRFLPLSAVIVFVASSLESHIASSSFSPKKIFLASFFS